METTSHDQPLKVVVFVDADVHSSYPFYTCVVTRLLDHGHHIALFTHYQEKPVLLLENPEPPKSSHTTHTSSTIIFQQRLTQADAVFIVTARNVHELSFSLPKFKIGKNAFDGHTYTWHTYGFSCILLGGWISDRKIAMKVRAILASADYPPGMTRALPKPAYLNGYVEDLSAETPGPCI